MSISAGNYSKQTVYGGGLRLMLVAEGGARLWRTDSVLQLNHFFLFFFLQKFILGGAAGLTSIHVGTLLPKAFAPNMFPSLCKKEIYGGASNTSRISFV